MKIHNASCAVVILTCLFASFFGGAAFASGETPAEVAESCTDIEPSAVVAYYFHGNMRCATCRKLEAYSEEAVTAGFADEIASGRLVWMAVNTDEAEHKHFVTDFELVTKSLVLVEYSYGEVERFENLDRIWKLVGDKDAFIEYVREATREFIGSS